MVGAGPRARAPAGSQTQQQALTPENDEVAKRAAKLSIERSRLDAAEARLVELRARGSRTVDEDALDDAADEAADARKDAARAARKLEEARRRN